MNNTENSTLKYGQYTIELANGPSMVFRLDESGTKEWVASCPDPQTAMDVVEGMILVETKRFYYPESKPSINFENPNDKKEEKIIPKFLKRPTKKE